MSLRLFLTSAAAAVVTAAAAAAALVLSIKILVFPSRMQILCVYIFNPSDQMSLNLLNPNLMCIYSPAPKSLTRVESFLQ